MKIRHLESFAGLVGPLQTASYVQYAVFCRTLRTTGGVEWDMGKLFDFASVQNGMMMLPVYNGKGHHSNTKRYADKIEAKMVELLANIPEPFDPANPTPLQIEQATRALGNINAYIRSVKRQIEDKIIKSDNLSLKDLTID